MKKILYLHGMCGGESSRIPSILKEDLAGVAQVTVHTYDFDPEKAREKVWKWFLETQPDLVIGESLGSLQALMLEGVPHIFVSPALGAPAKFDKFSFCTLLPFFTLIFNRIYRPHHEGRQKPDFRYSILRKYVRFAKEAFTHTPQAGSTDRVFAFFGTKDHFRKSGIVSIELWKSLMEPQGVEPDSTYAIYEGTHFMENEFVHTLLVDKILEVLGIERYASSM